MCTCASIGTTPTPFRWIIDHDDLLGAEVRKITVPDGQASRVAEHAVRQLMSEGLAAGDVIDVFGIADKDRPEISVLSDEFLDSTVGRTDRNIQIRLFEGHVMTQPRRDEANPPSISYEPPPPGSSDDDAARGQQMVNISRRSGPKRSAGRANYIAAFQDNSL